MKPARTKRRQLTSNELWMWRRKAIEKAATEAREQDTKCSNKKCRRLAWARVTIPGAFVAGLCRPCTEALRDSLNKNLGDAA